MSDCEEELSVFNELDIKISKQLKHLLNYCGFASLDLIENLSQENLEEMERYIRLKAQEDSAFDDDFLRSKYFGSSTLNEVKKFSFNPGSRVILLKSLPEAAKKSKRYLLC